MKSKTKNIIVLIIFVLIFLLLGVLTMFGGKIKPNPQGTIGNTAGNLNNSGLFCEYNQTVYFANSYDGLSLYAMNSDGSNVRKLNNTRSQNILAGGDYLYYFQIGASGDTGVFSIRSINSFVRCHLDGSHATGLTRNTVVTAQLIDNHLYLLTAGKTTPEFHKMKIDESESEMLAAYSINPACARDGIIYYNGTQNDHYLYTLQTNSDTSSVLWRGNLWYPAIDGDYIYYMDVENNYRLCRYSLSQDVVQVLTNDRVDCFNVGHGYIYYQKNSAEEPELISMGLDGSNKTVLANGNFTNIHITSYYVYFQPVANETITYQLPLGGTQYTEFDAARNAAAINQQTK